MGDRRIMRASVAALVLGALLPTEGDAYSCEVVTREHMTNNGPSIGESALSAVTPFSIGAWDGVVAFNEDHCIQMCCEHVSCYVAVFDHTEAVCYLKGSTARRATAFEDTNDFTCYEILSRGGSAEPIALEPTECNNKRGLAFDFQDADDLEALAGGMSWWYNWSPNISQSEVAVAQSTSGSEYMPMIWGTKDLTDARLSGLDSISESSHLLTFNEPNFGSQASLTPAEAANEWAIVKMEAAALGADIVSPAVNYCGGDCNTEDPVQWLDEFFENCAAIEDGCGVTAIAVHTYACEVRYLNKILNKYLKYDLPLWLTEFACADDATFMNEEGQEAFLAEAITLLELHPSVARYAWFTGRGADEVGVTGADLLAGVGEITTLGSIFVETYKDLQRCETFVFTEEKSDDEPTQGTSTVGSTEETSDDEPTQRISTVGSTEETSDDDSTQGTSAGSDLIVEPGDTAGGTDVDSTATEITNVVISNLGGDGTYNEVVSMAPGSDLVCSEGENACVKEELAVSGTLAPFDEPVTVAFRGPLNLYNIAWYEGTADSLSQTSTWTPETSSNLVFMNNLGGSMDCSGVWTICGGNGQSYSDETGDYCSEEPQQFAGVLDSDKEVQIATATTCADSGTCGYYRDTGMQGWAGGSDGTKVMVFEVDMPHCGESGFSECTHNRPAVWALNAKVTQTAQYGCNCRGAGGNGGCGEFDIIEAVIGVDYSDMMFTTVYDFKGTGAPGHSKYFLRPSDPAHYAAIFRGGDNAYLQVVQLTDWDYSQTTVTGTFLDNLHAASSEIHDIYDVPA